MPFRSLWNLKARDLKKHHQKSDVTMELEFPKQEASNKHLVEAWHDIGKKRLKHPKAKITLNNPSRLEPLVEGPIAGISETETRWAGCFSKGLTGFQDESRCLLLEALASLWSADVLHESWKPWAFFVTVHVVLTLFYTEKGSVLPLSKDLGTQAIR